MGKLRIYKLAKELRRESRKIIEEARRLGVNVKVPSNQIDDAIADKIRSKYKPISSGSKTESQAIGRVRLVKAVPKSESKPSSTQTRMTAPITQGQSQDSTSSASRQAKEIILESKKAKWIGEKGKCSKCLVTTRPLWKYSKSNWGEIYLCSRCKPIVYARSFEKLDALDVAEQGGLFESNRRKH